MKYLASAAVAAILVWSLVALGTGSSGAAEPPNHPLTRTEPAKIAAFKIDPEKDVRITLGRGSGMDGFETVALGRDGQVTLYRLKWQRIKGVYQGKWQKTATSVDRPAISRLLAAIDGNKIMEMAAQYHADVYDGTQWILLIQQGEASKAIYFNNHFPDGILKFAKALDAEIKASAIPEAKWEDDPNPRGHDKALRESVD